MAASISIDKITVPLALLAGLMAGAWGFSRSIVTTQDLAKALEVERTNTLVTLGPVIDSKVARLETAIGTLSTKVGDLAEKVAALQASPH